MHVFFRTKLIPYMSLFHSLIVIKAYNTQFDTFWDKVYSNYFANQINECYLQKKFLLRFWFTSQIIAFKANLIL